MAEKVTDPERVKKWTHGEVIGEHQQYTFKRLLKLDSTLLQEIRARNIIGKKQKNAVVSSGYNMDYFLAVIKMKDIDKFVQFLEVLEATFSWNENHKVLVSTMSEYLVDMVGLSETTKATVDRIVYKSTLKTGHFQETEISHVEVNEGRDLFTETQTLVPHYSQSTKEGQENENGTPDLTSKRIQLPKCFVEPHHIQIFERNECVHWELHSVEHGLAIKIDQAAVPCDIQKFTLTVHAYLSGPFEIPEEYEVCSAIFILQLQPNFKFCKPVDVQFPHCVLVEDDDPPEDFIVLHASDPSIEPSSTAECIYKFCDVIDNVQYSEYYVQTTLDKFCGIVAAKRKRKHRPASLPFTASRIGKQRRRRRSVIRKTAKKLLSNDSTGSSRHSSLEGSFDRDGQSPQQHSAQKQQRSLEREVGMLTKPLQRQFAMEHDDEAINPPHHNDVVSCNEICIMCCSPKQTSTSWTTTFLVAPNTPTGQGALSNASRVLSEKDTFLQIATPTKKYIGFEPQKWQDSNWVVHATSTSQIHSSLFQRREISDTYQLPHVEFDVECITQSAFTTLCHEITVTGVEGNGEKVFFTIKSDKNHAKLQENVIHTELWLYENGSKIVEAVRNRCDVDLDTSCPDHCKLLADIALQIPARAYEGLLNEYAFPEAVRDQLEAGEKSNLPECVFNALYTYVGGEQRRSYAELKSSLARVGIKDIQLRTSDIPLLSNLSIVEPDESLLVGLAKQTLGMQWRFVGRFLGLSNIEIDGLHLTFGKEDTEEVSMKLLHKWRQQCFETANIPTLIKALFRIQQLNPRYISEPWWWFQTEISEKYCTER